MINPERYRQIDELFQAALEVAPAERSAFVSSACNGDESLRQEVEAMLASVDDEWSFIDHPAPEIGALFLPDQHPELIAGERLGHYNIVSLLGTGGMGQVYLAEDSRLGRKVALKVLPSEFTRNEFRLRRFQYEARAASSLNHPNILTIHEIGRADERHFIATEFIDGETLRRRMNRSRLSLVDTLRVAVQAAEALAAAHAAGIVHRDIKPENIMLRPDGYIKVLDFGLAKLTEGHAQESSTIDKADTRSGMIMGTVRYMSPEQARGQEADARCDIFSLGVVIYEMIAGRAPFEGETNNDLIAALLKIEPPPLSQSVADAPAELQNIVTKALCKDRDQRYQTIEDMLAGIERLKDQLDLDAKLQRSAQSAPKGEAATSLSQPGIRVASISTRIIGKIKRHKRATAVIAAAMVLLAAGGWWATERYFKAREMALPFQERDWVLITAFDNRTGEAVFDGSVEYAVERELSNSSYVNVIPRERALDALQLMKKAPDTKIDTTVGKEICLRDGAIRALLDGRIEKLGSTYALSVRLIDPVTSHGVASTSEEASSQEQIASATRRLSNWVRGTLGEALASIKKDNQELAKVTTPSLRALQLYSQANVLMKLSNHKVAEQLLRQALVEDPEFASAHMLIAWSIRNQRRDDWRPSSERALELSERVSERERLFILGSYYHQKNEIDKATSAYEALVQRYPDDFWGSNNLSGLYRQTGRNKEGVHYSVLLAKLRPNDCDAQVRAAASLSAPNQLVDAMIFVNRARELVSEGAQVKPNYAAFLEYMPAVETYSRGDLETSLKMIDRLAQIADSRSGRERDEYANLAANGYGLLGKLRAVEELAEKTSQGRLRAFILAKVAFTRNDETNLRKHSLTYFDQGREPSPVYLAQAGLISQLQKTLQSWRGADGSRKVFEGQIALSQGHRERAISLLEAGVNSLRPENGPYLAEGWDSLATAYEQRGDSANLLRVLEQATEELGLGNKIIWLKMKLRLAQLYRKMGRADDAHKIETELVRLLTYADEDHPILVQLRRVQGK